MKATNNIWEGKDDFRNYLSQINWDAFILKVQLIIAGAGILVLFGYLLLFQ